MRNCKQLCENNAKCKSIQEFIEVHKNVPAFCSILLATPHHSPPPEKIVH